jgi:hypothetical protein
MSDDYVWIPTYGTGSAHGATEKPPAKRPLGFVPPRPTVVVQTVYRPKQTS